MQSWQIKVFLVGIPEPKHVIILGGGWHPGWGVDTRYPHRKTPEMDIFQGSGLKTNPLLTDFPLYATSAAKHSCQSHKSPDKSF